MTKQLNSVACFYRVAPDSGWIFDGFVKAELAESTFDREIFQKENPNGTALFLDLNMLCEQAIVDTIKDLMNERNGQGNEDSETNESNSV